MYTVHCHRMVTKGHLKWKSKSFLMEQMSVLGLILLEAGAEMELLMVGDDLVAKWDPGRTDDIGYKIIICQ